MSPALDKAMAAIPADIAESVMPPPAGSTIEACATAVTPTIVTTVTRRACTAGIQSCRGAATAGAGSPTWSARSASDSGRRPTFDRQRRRGDDRPPVEADPRRHRARRPRRQRHRPGTPRRRGYRIGGPDGRQSVTQSVSLFTAGVGHRSGADARDLLWRRISENSRTLGPGKTRSRPAS